MDELKYMIAQCREMKGEAERSNQYLKELKDKLRTFMVDAGVNKYEGVEVRRAFSLFDAELLRIELPEVFERFFERVREEIITYRNDPKKEFKKLKELYPDLWNDEDYRKEQTARLYGL